MRELLGTNDSSHQPIGEQLVKQAKRPSGMLACVYKMGGGGGELSCLYQPSHTDHNYSLHNPLLLLLHMVHMQIKHGRWRQAAAGTGRQPMQPPTFRKTPTSGMNLPFFPAFL